MPRAFWGEWTFEVPEEVYFPAEDTYLMLDYLAEHIRIEQPHSICEIGCGSGIIGITLAKINPSCQVCLADINSLAVSAAQANIRVQGVQDRVSVFESDLFSKFSWERKFDWILFNPPYLPSSGELESSHTQQQTEGGPLGIEITQRFLKSLPPFLKNAGKGYFITSSFSSITDIERTCEENEFNLKRVDSMHVFFEDIILFEMQR